jgi:hypothetical protein
VPGWRQALGRSGRRERRRRPAEVTLPYGDNDRQMIAAMRDDGKRFDR